MTGNEQHLQSPVVDYVRKDFARLREDLTVREALDFIRQKGVGEQIVYFYVVDNDERLLGVVPTRRLLTADLESRLAQIMERRMVSIPSTATLLEACEMFVLHKFL